LLSFVSNIFAGLLIGLANDTWFGVLFACAAWGVVTWLFIEWVGGRGRAVYTPEAGLFFGSPTLTGFIVWWSSGFVISAVIGSLTYAVSTMLSSD
jgi:hypothetical protein